MVRITACALHAHDEVLRHESMSAASSTCAGGASSCVSSQVASADEVRTTPVPPAAPAQSLHWPEGTSSRIKKKTKKTSPEIKLSLGVASALTRGVPQAVRICHPCLQLRLLLALQPFGVLRIVGLILALSGLRRLCGHAHDMSGAPLTSSCGGDLRTYRRRPPQVAPR